MQGLEDSEIDFLIGALDATYAIIVFQPNGTILGANSAFLGAMGYEADEVVGQHHRIFMDPAEAALPDYYQFWRDLASGHLKQADFRRKTKDGSDIWISASYTPVRDRSGKVLKIVKLCTDITERKIAVAAITDALVKLASGNISTRLGDDVRGEFADVRDRFNKAAEGFEATIRPVMGIANNLSDLGDALEEESRDLAHHTAEQSERLERTAAIVREIAEDTKKVHGAAVEVDKDARAAAEKAGRGSAIVRDTINAISNIEAITGEVNNTIKVIESFAFQTNLLALNAAVEAARAGEAGRGFSVVATEVRSLAQRSAEASKTISDLTKRCEVAVAEGNRLALSAGDALSEIDASVGNVVSATDRIVVASQNQTTRYKDADTSVTDLSRNVRTMTSLADTGAGNAQRLREQLIKLSNAVERFSTRNARGGARAAFRGTERRKTPGAPQRAIQG